MISASIAPAFVVHDTRTIPHSAWGRKARREGGGLYFHARGRQRRSHGRRLPGLHSEQERDEQPARRRDTASDTRSDRTLTSYPVGQGECNSPPLLRVPPEIVPPCGAPPFREGTVGTRAQEPSPTRRVSSGYATCRHAPRPKGEQRARGCVLCEPARGAPTVGACPASTPNRRETSSPHGGVILRQTHAPQTVMYKEYTPVCVGVIFLV